jgi:hypothetical protein
MWRVTAALRSVFAFNDANGIAAVEVIHSRGDLDDGVAGVLGRLGSAAVEFAAGIGQDNCEAGICSSIASRGQNLSPVRADAIAGTGAEGGLKLGGGVYGERIALVAEAAYDVGDGVREETGLVGNVRICVVS